MKKLTFLLTMLLVSTLTWAQADPIASCDFTAKTAGHQAYGDAWTYGDWSVYGAANNQNGWAYAKFGGKSATIANANPCYIFGQLASSVSKIVVTTNAGNLTKAGSINSWGVKVYSDAEKTTEIGSVLGGTMTKGTAETLELVPEAAWPANSYYQVYFDLANKTTTNGIVWIDKIDFYGASSEPTVTEVALTYHLDGGITTDLIATNNEDLWKAFMPAYNAYYNLERAEQTIDKVSTFAPNLMEAFVTADNSEWKWLGAYIKSVAEAQSKDNLSGEGAWRWYVHSFFNAGNGSTAWGTTADFTEAGKAEVWTAAVTTQLLPTTITEAYTLPALTKAGYEFLGWFTDAEFTQPIEVVKLGTEAAVTLYAEFVAAETYTKTDWFQVTEQDEILLTWTTAEGKTYAMENGTISKAPKAVLVTVTDGKITTSATNLQWTRTYDQWTPDLPFAFSPKGDTEGNQLYIKDDNNGVGIGFGEDFMFDIKSGYLYANIIDPNTYEISATRYLGVYNGQDVRCYKTTDTNIKDQTFAIYAKQIGDRPKPVESITFEPASFQPGDLIIGETLMISALVLPEDATYRNVKWTISDENVASISMGMLTIKGHGEATITATTPEGITASMVINVPEPTEPTTYTKTDWLDVGNEDDILLTWKVGENVYALENTLTEKNPKVVLVTVEDDKITTDATNIVWNRYYDAWSTGLPFAFNPKGDTDYNQLFVSSDNEGVGVGGGEDFLFDIDSTGYLYADIMDMQTWKPIETRYLGVFGENSELRCYTAADTATYIKDQIFTIYAKQNGERPVRATGINIDPAEIAAEDLEIGLTTYLSASFTPENATYKTVTWTSSNEEVATVGIYGNLTIKAHGEAVITVTTMDGGHKATLNINFPEPGPDTGIENISELDQNAPMYNVLGQRVSADYKGIVIQNGKKFVLE